MGFIHDVKKVLALVPHGKQSLLFSATFSDEIRELAGGLLRDPQHIQVTPRNTTVQRIAQVIHPVGRAKKKALLAHIIQQHDWSQVLVFTRTKFGANHVAEFLNKHGVTAMALHGNKSQSARTQALAGFKSGEIRALVATDIAARGIDIDDLPHVVNYEIPNVPEDYVHRIGRTGRAGKEGQAVSLVCLDEEGFMQEIERFTKQQIPVQVIDGFAADEGERAEPIAMGRQTLWGGLGKPPSREVMAAAAKAARQEMMQRIRENKARGQEGAAASDDAGTGRPGSRNGRRDGGRNGGGRAGGGRNGPGHGSGNGPRDNARDMPRASGDQPRQARDHEPRDADAPPRHIDPLRTNMPGRRDMTGLRRVNSNGQPDPTRTSIDSLGSSARRSGGGKRRRGGGGGGGGGRPSGSW